MLLYFPFYLLLIYTASVAILFHFVAVVLICRFRIFLPFHIYFCIRLLCAVTVSDSAVAVVMLSTFYDYGTAFHFAGMVQLLHYFMIP